LFLVPGQWRFALVRIVIHLALELHVPCLALSERSLQIVLEFDFLLVDGLEATGQHNAVGGVLAEVYVVTSVHCRHDETQALRFWRMEVSGVCQ